MASISSRVFLGAFALILLGFHLIARQTDARKIVGIDEDREFAVSNKKSKFNFGMYPKGISIPLSRSNGKILVDSYTTLPSTPFTILEKESKFNFRIYPKGVFIPPSGPNGRTSGDKYAPPPPPWSGPHYQPGPWDGPCRRANPPRYCILLRRPPPPSPHV